MFTVCEIDHFTRIRLPLATKPRTVFLLFSALFCAFVHLPGKMALLNSSVPTDQSATSTPSSPNSTSGTAPRVRPGQHRQWLTLAVHFPSRLQHRGGRAFWRQGRWEGPINSTRKLTFLPLQYKCCFIVYLLLLLMPTAPSLFGGLSSKYLPGPTLLSFWDQTSRLFRVAWP